MNYAGQFDATSAPDGQSTQSHAYGHVDSFPTHAPADAIVVPDAELLFHGDFKRAGSDLILSGDEREFVVHDYFKGGLRKALASVDGAHLTADLVNALTGEVQISQADNSAQAGRVIGHCTKLVGSATVVRNGVSIVLNIGDNVEKGDVVQSGSDSTIGITFIDGTVFGLSANARMVLNEMVYDPNGSNNSSLMSLVAGTITFVAGETAKHGDMKIDTPVATMGIRGTAVLVEIDFNATSGSTDANFQVLVEPDGHTGSYILFDKLTLQPLAVVDTAALKYSFKDGLFSVGQSSLTQLQKDLIGDVFKQVFSDNSNPNSNTHATDSINPFLNGQQFTLLHGFNATIINATNVNNGGTSTQQTQSSLSGALLTDPGAPTLTPAGIQFAANELLGKTADHAAIDSVGSTISYVDKSPNIPSATVSFDTATFQSNTPSQTPSQLEKADIATLTSTDLLAISFQQNGTGGTDSGVAGTFTWIYAVHDDAFDFLAQGETLTLHYNLTISNSYGPNPETSTVPLTITIVGTNDKPVITTAAPPTIALEGGTSQQGGPLETTAGAPASPTTGTFKFTDVDLTDTHTVAVSLETPVLTDKTGAAVQFTTAPGPLEAFENALTAEIQNGDDSTGSGNGTITWTFTPPDIFNADIIPAGDTLTLTYDVTVTDPFGASSMQTVTVTIVGTDKPAFVWIATTSAGTQGGLWGNFQNWETKTVPGAGDDAIVVTNQLLGETPSFPATINAPAAVHSLTLSDFDVGAFDTAPTVDNQSTLTVGAGGISLNNDAVITNEGSMSVIGAFEFHNADATQNPDGSSTPAPVTLTNSGTLVLSGGGDFAGPANVTNSGTFELAGGTLNVAVNIANTDGETSGTIRVDAGTMLVLDPSTISGGALANYGTVNLEGASGLKTVTLSNVGQVNVSGTGNLFDDTTVTNKVQNNPITGALVTNDDTSVAKPITTDTLLVGTAGDSSDDLGTAITDGSTLTVDGKTVTFSAAQTDVTVDANGNVTIGIAVGSALTVGDLLNAIDAITGTTVPSTVVGGEIVLSTGTIQNLVISGTGNALAGLGLAAGTTNFAGAIDVTGALTLDDGTSITNAAAANTVTVEGTGSLTLQDTSSISGGVVTNKGALNLQGASELENGTLANTGVVNVSGTGVTFSNESVTNNDTVAPATDIIDISGSLTLENASHITNGASNDVTVETTGTLTLQDTSSISTGTVTNKGALNLQGTSELENGTLANTGVVNVSGTGVTFSNESVTNTGATVATDIIDITGSLTLESGSHIINGASNDVTVETTGTLTLQDTSSISTGTVTNKGTLNLQGTSELENGMLANTGVVNVSGTGVTFSNESVTNTGATAATDIIDIAGSLTLESGSHITNGASNDVTVEKTGTLTLEDTSYISTGTVTNKGALNLQGTSELENGTLANTGVVNVSGTGVTFSNESVTNNDTVAPATDIIDISGSLTLNGTSSITNGANNIVAVESTGSLTLNGSTIKGGELNNSATVAIETAGTTSTFDGVTVTNGNANANIQVDTGGGPPPPLPTTLKLDDGTSISQGKVTIGPSGILEVASILGAALTDVSVGNSNIVQVDAGSTLTLNGSTIKGGGLNNSATVAIETAGTTSTFDGVDVTNIGTSANIQVDTGLSTTLKLDDGASINQGSVTIGPSGILEISSALGATLNGVLVSNSNSILVDSGSLLSLEGTSVTGTGTVTVTGELDNVSGSNTIDGAVTDTGTIDVQAGTTLDLAGGLYGGGTVKIDAGATLRVAGADAETFTFTGGAGTSTLELDNTAIPFTGTITANAIADGNFVVTGAANITAASGDGLDVTATGGTAQNPAEVTVTPSGTISGHVNGIVVKQEGVGDLTVDPSGNVIGLAGNGITVEDTAGGSGNITVDDTHSVTGTGSGSVGLLVENLNTANNGTINVTATGGALGAQYGIQIVNDGSGNVTLEAGGTIAGAIQNGLPVGTSQYGIRVFEQGSGSETVTTDVGSDIVSNGSGIDAVNVATSILSTANSSIEVTAYGTISSGGADNTDGSPPAGILAGYRGGSENPAAPNLDVTGNVTVDNYANITAAANSAGAGYGINAYNFGNGDVTVNEEAGTAVQSADIGIIAQALGGEGGGLATGNVSVTLGQNVTVGGISPGNAKSPGNATSGHGVEAFSTDAGNISVTMASGDFVNAGSSGILAVNEAQAIASNLNSTITVTAYGTIDSGATNNPDGSAPAGIDAGYVPGGNSSAVNSDVVGNVFIYNYATVNATANSVTGGYGIQGFNRGAGNVTITNEAGASITVTGPGDGIGAFAVDGGSVTVTNDLNATDTAAVGLAAYADLAGTISITNDGQISGTVGDGIDLTQNATGQLAATGASTITNSGTITGAINAIHVLANATGTATIDNLHGGTIGSTAADHAIFETGGTVSIDNHGTIDGTINVGNGTFTNEGDGVWNVAGTNDFTAGTVTIDNIGTINLSGSGAISDGTLNNNGTLNLQGTSELENGTLANVGVIDVGGTGVTFSNESVTNTGSEVATDIIDVTGALTLENASSIISGDSNDVTVEKGASLTLEDTSYIKDGLLTNLGNVFVEKSAGAAFDDVDVNNTDGTNVGTIHVDTAQTPATLILENGTQISSGTIDIGDVGTLEIKSAAGATLSGVEVDVTSDANGTGVVQVDDGSILKLAGTINHGIINDYSGLAGGTIDIIGPSTIENATLNKGGVTIESGQTLTLSNDTINGTTVTFDGTGDTLKLDATSAANAGLTLAGLQTGDIIDLTGTSVQTAVWDSATSTLYINGVATAFHFSGELPAGDTFGFKSDGSGGTLLEVLPQTLAVGSSPATGVETDPVQLHFSDTLTGATLTSFVIGNIPAGDVLSDGAHTQTINSGSYDVAGWDLSHLTITPVNDVNFTLSAMVESTDPNGFNYTVPATELVTVDPTQPSLSWVASERGTETTIQLGQLVDLVTAQTGDTNSLNTLTISGAPAGAVLSDGHGDSVVSDGSTPINVLGWSLSTLTIDTSKVTVPDNNFTLTAMASEIDGDTDVSTTPSITATEQVTIKPAAPVLNWSATASGTEANVNLGSLAYTLTSFGSDSNSLNSLTISGVPKNAVLSDGAGGHSVISDGSTPISVLGWTLSSLAINTANASIPDGNFNLTATATEIDGNNDISNPTTASEFVTVVPEAPNVAPVAAVGVEGAVIPLNLGITTAGLGNDVNKLNSVTLTFTVPTSDTYTFTATGLNTTFTAGANQTLTLTPAQLASLSIKTLNASNVTLQVSATQIDADGDVGPAGTGTENVTVKPTAPTLSWSPASASGTEDAGVNLQLVFTATGAAGDSNILNAITVKLPTGATISDGTHSVTAIQSVNQDSINITGWNLGNLTITPANGSSFSVTATATEKDSEGNTSAPTTATIQITETASTGYLWGTTVIPTSGKHNFNPIGNYNGGLETGVLLYGTTPSSDFNNGYPVVLTESAVLYDPFLLGYRSGIQTVQSSSTFSSFKYQAIMPNTASGPEAIVFYSTESSSGVATIYQQIISESSSGPNGSVTDGSPTTLESNLNGNLVAFYDGFTNFNVSDVSTPSMTSYDLAWGLYNSATGDYTASFQIFPTGGNPTAVVTIEHLSNLASTALPAWEFRNAGGLNDHGVSVPYAAILAVADQNHAGQTDVAFQGYNVNGSANPDVHFLITPDLTAFQPGATNTITQPSTGASLLFTPNGVPGSGFSAAWSETVTDSLGTHYQVEFAIFKASGFDANNNFGNGALISQTTYQVSDPQNVRVGSFASGGQSFEYLVYGDANSTTVIEFDQTGHQVASITDTAHPGVTYNDFEVMGDGRIALAYADATQYTTDVFDLRLVGLNDPALSTSGPNYIAGTEYGDTVLGANGVNNFYEFVGSATSAPASHFTGGTGNSFNEAVFADARSEFTISLDGSTAVVTSHDSAYGGVLDTSDVQALVFGATSDPAPNSAGGLEVTSGETLVMLGNFQNGNTYPVTVDAGGTLEIMNANSSENVAFASAGGASLLVLDHSHSFSGTITGLTEFSTESLENHVDLMDLAYRQGHMSTTYSNGLLTIRNGLDSVTLHVSPTQGFDPAFEFANDGSGHTLIDDPSPSGAMTIDSNQTLDISGVGSGTVTFTNSNGNNGALVLGDSKDFTGLIIGFTGDGTPDNSASIDLQDINFVKLTTETYTENAGGTGGILTLSDGTNTTSLNFLGDHALANFNFSSDGNGGTVLNEATPTAPVVTPPSAVTDTLTANNGIDQFVFAPTTNSAPVQHTIINFNVNLDTINLQQFGNTIVSATDLIANHTTQVGSDALIAIDSNDSILLKNVQVANLHTSDFLVHA